MTIARTAPGPDLSGHLCQVCGLYGAYGFGPHDDVRWYCKRHMAIGKKWLDDLRGAGAQMAIMPNTVNPSPTLF